MEKHNFIFEKYDYLIMPVTSVPPFSVEKEYPDKVNGVKLNTYLDWMWPAIPYL